MSSEYFSCGIVNINKCQIDLLHLNKIQQGKNIKMSFIKVMN